jgi:hypothetical protein
MSKPIANNRIRIPLLVKGDKRIGSAGFWNKLIRTANAFRSLMVVAGAKSEFVIGDETAILSLDPSLLGGGGGTGTAAVYRCEVTACSANDTLTCLVTHGSLADTSISVEKPILLKGSITSEVIEGLTVSYTYASGPNYQERTAAATGYASALMRLYPKYIARVMAGETVVSHGSYIYAASVEGYGYVDINADARGWQAVPYVPIP